MQNARIENIPLLILLIKGAAQPDQHPFWDKGSLWPCAGLRGCIQSQSGFPHYHNRSYYACRVFHLLLTKESSVSRIVHIYHTCSRMSGAEFSTSSRLFNRNHRKLVFFFFFLKYEQKPCTLQAKSIDFYGPGEIDEGMCVQNVDTDELLGQVDYNTWQYHNSRFTTFDPLQEKLARREKKQKNPAVKMKR